jgi:hypothetical protein
MVNYASAKIYKIVCDTTNKTYIGSTTVSLSRRLTQHKCEYKRFNDEKRPYKMSSYETIENDNYKIILIEECPCENKEQLLRKEREHIDSNICVNKVLPTRTPQEYHQDHKDILNAKSKEYFEVNHDKINKQRKEFRDANKERLKEYFVANREILLIKKKEFREANKDKIKAYRDANKDQAKRYYEENKEKIAEYKKKLCCENKDVIKQKQKEYYEKNKAKILEKQRLYKLAKRQADI